LTTDDRITLAIRRPALMAKFATKVRPSSRRGLARSALAWANAFARVDGAFALQNSSATTRNAQTCGRSEDLGTMFLTIFLPVRRCGWL
jgi:hypothetical protein